MPYKRVEDTEKLRRLVDAVLMIEADIDRPALLRHIVEEAANLVEARYGSARRIPAEIDDGLASFGAQRRATRMAGSTELR